MVKKTLKKEIETINPQMTLNAIGLQLYHGNRTPIFQAVAGFYALEEINAGIGQADMFNRGIEKFSEDFVPFRKTYVKKLAKTLYDYLALASFGEARYARRKSHDPKKTGKFDTDKSVFFHALSDGEYPGDKSRNWAVERAVRFNPKTFLPVLVELFSKKNYRWEDGYGGDKWSKIAEAAAMYGTMPDEVFIDHVVDLTHNGSYCFDKGMLIAGFNKGAYGNMLDKKTESSVLGYRTIGMSQDIDDFVVRAENLGIVKKRTQYKYFDMGKIDTILFPLPIEWGKASVLEDYEAMQDKRIETPKKVAKKPEVKHEEQIQETNIFKEGADRVHKDVPELQHV